MMKRMIPFAVALLAAPVFADPPRVENVKVSKRGDTFNFDVTISHRDTGWANFADAWRVVDPDGNELGLRNLAHPHEHEQPFTWSLSNVRIPDELSYVEIQTRDTIGGWYPDTYRVQVR